MADVLDVHELQARAEGIELVDDLRIEFMGEHFKLRDKIGKMALLRFAAMADSGEETGGMKTLAAMYKLLRACIVEEDWERFGDHADETAADEDDLLAVVGQAIELVTARPTRRPAVSSAGPPATSANSKGSSTLRLVQGYGESLETAEQMRARLTA
ncbi:hypothetical protein [Actinoplanes rectilineatus]|uniref:hypothetical protein n=1 Tax=Actinoplanes rectilineatus TaxID=113571 RepID=UPI0005F2A835|nr:hypothetical protein [Actinoplanes rectilineatus]